MRWLQNLAEFSLKIVFFLLVGALVLNGDLASDESCLSFSYRRADGEDSQDLGLDFMLLNVWRWPR